MSSFVHDTFTGPTSKLTAHVGETGTTWKAHPAAYCSTNLFSLTGSGSVYNDTGSFARGMIYASGVPTTPDYTVSARMIWHTSTGEAYDGIALRWSVTEATGYVLYFVSPSQHFELYRINNGQLTLLGTSENYTLISGTPQTIDVTVFEGSITCRFNSAAMTGGLAETVVDSEPVIEAGHVGLMSVDLFAASATTGIHWTDILAHDAGVVLPATGISLTGAVQGFGVAGVASSNFTLAPTGGIYTGTITPSDGGAGGTFTPASLTWSAAQDPKTFTYTPSSGGRKIIRVTASPVLSPPPPLAYQVMLLWVGGSGTTLTVSFGSDYGDPTVTAVPGPAPTYRINNGSPITAGLAVWCDPQFEGTSAPHVTYLLPTKIAENQTITVSLTADSIVTTAGSCPTLVDVSCVSYAGEHSPLHFSPSDERTMRLGGMWYAGNYYEPIPVYANKAKTGSPNWSGSDGTAWGIDCGGFDAEGMPVNSSEPRKKLCIAPMDAPELFDGYPHAATGRYTLLWDGPGNADLNINSTATHDDPTQRVITGATNNIRVYPGVTAFPGKLAPSIFIWIDETNGTVSNIRLFDKHITDVLNPPKFHPLAMEKLAGIKVFRAKDWVYTDNGCPVAEFTDHTPSSTLSILDQRQDGRVGITRFEPYTDAAYVRDGEQGIKVTCAAPHNLAAGQFVSLYFPSEGAPWPFMHAIPHEDASVENVSWSNAMAMVISATEFVIKAWFSSPIVAHDLPVGSQLWKKWGGAPVQDAIDLTNEMSDCTAWFAIPHAATDRYVTDFFTYLAGRLAAGRRVWFEYTNEPWNGDPAYPQFHFIRVMAREFALARPNNPAWDADEAIRARRWYVMRAGQIRALARAAWTAAGRDVNDLGLALNAQFVNSNRALEFAADADLIDTHGRHNTDPAFSGPIQFEGFAVAPYVFSHPYSNSSITTAQYDAMTVPQVMDIGDAFQRNIRATMYGAIAKTHANNLTTLAAAGRPGIKYLCYEGGPSVMGLGGTPTQQHLRTVAWSLHPRARAQFLAHLELFNEVGVREYVKYGMFGNYVLENGYGHCYNTYAGLEQRAGLGDGTDGLHDNRPDIMNSSGMAIKPSMAYVVSPIGSAVRTWGQTVSRPMISAAAMLLGM